jgi:hypothetical protein
MESCQQQTKSVCSSESKTGCGEGGSCRYNVVVVVVKPDREELVRGVGLCVCGGKGGGCIGSARARGEGGVVHWQSVCPGGGVSALAVAHCVKPTSSSMCCTDSCWWTALCPVLCDLVRLLQEE